jgi:hypothetical protein
MDAPKKKVRIVKGKKTGEKPGEAAKVTPEQVCQGILPLDSITPPPQSPQILSVSTYLFDSEVSTLDLVTSIKHIESFYSLSRLIITMKKQQQKRCKECMTP